MYVHIKLYIYRYILLDEIWDFQSMTEKWLQWGHYVNHLEYEAQARNGGEEVLGGNAMIWKYSAIKMVKRGRTGRFVVLQID